jgi:hypothetical protein
MPRSMLALVLATAVVFGTLPLLSLLWIADGPSVDGSETISVISEPVQPDGTIDTGAQDPVAYGLDDPARNCDHLQETDAGLG